MRAHNYLFRISCLELFYPVIINDDIYIIPNSDNMRDNLETNFSYIDFKPSSFSYLLIMSEEPINREELENLAKQTISMLIVLLLNPLYLEEFYHFKQDKGNVTPVEVTIKPFEGPDLKKKRNYLHGRLAIYSFNEIARDLFKKILDNPISDSLYSIIMEYIVSHKNPLIEISGTIAWNVLEQIVSRYWEKKNKEKLYIITEEKLNDYIGFLDTKAGQFIDDNIEKYDVMLDLPEYKNNYKELLKRTITRNIMKFSPVKFRIFRLFEEEKITDTPNRELIKDMYNIRVFRFHYGLSLAEIQHKIGKNPIDVIVRFKPFLYRKILEFIGFIDEFFVFYSGHLINKVESSELPDKPKFKPKLDEYQLVQEIKSLDNLLERLMGTTLDTHIKDEDKKYEVTTIISKKEGEYIITFLDPPQIFHFGLDKIPSKDENYPEDIIKYLRPIICTFTNTNIQYEIEFYNRPINYPRFDIKINQSAIEKWVAEQYGKKIEIKKETSKIDFKITKITMKKID